MTALEEEREAVREAVELLNFVGLAERADLNALSLPFGQQRMLEIARAMATEPDVLLLDEPNISNEYLLLFNVIIIKFY